MRERAGENSLNLLSMNKDFVETWNLAIAL